MEAPLSMLHAVIKTSNIVLAVVIETSRGGQEKFISSLAGYLADIRLLQEQ